MMKIIWLIGPLWDLDALLELQFWTVFYILASSDFLMIIQSV